MSHFNYSPEIVRQFVSESFPELSAKEALVLEMKIRAVQLELKALVEERLTVEEEEWASLEADFDPHGVSNGIARRGEWSGVLMHLASAGHGRVKRLNSNSGYEPLSFWSGIHNSKNRSQWERSGREARRLTNRARRRADLI